MRGSTPPKMATWLLKQFGCGPMRESLTGDLVEQYQHGRAASWYWRQVLNAIVSGTSEDLWANKWRSVRGLGAAWAILWLYYRYAYRWSEARWLLFRIANLDAWLFEKGLVSHYVAWQDPFRPWLGLAVTGLVGGWIIGSAVRVLHRNHQIPIVLPFCVSLVLFSIGRFSWTMTPCTAYVQALLANGTTLTSLLLGTLWGAGGQPSSGPAQTVSR
jgi:hypothetical protein